MAKLFDVKEDEAGLEVAVAAATAEIADQFNRSLRTMIGQVRAETRDMPADQVYAEIMRRMKGVVPDLVPDETVRRKIAQAVSEGSSMPQSSVCHDDNPTANPMRWQGPDRSLIYRRGVDLGWR